MQSFEPNTLGVNRNSVADNSSSHLLDNPLMSRTEPVVTSQEEHMMDDEYLDVPSSFIRRH